MKIKECLNRHDSCVYCLIFPDGKYYVGKTLDLGKRMSLYVGEIGEDSGGVRRVIDSFGADSVDVRILFSMSGQKKDDKDICLSLMEIKYIRELKCVHPDGYNVSLGGEVLGIPIEYLTTDTASIRAFRSSCKAVLEYDIDGNFVREYESIARCAYEKGVSEDDIRSAMKRNSPFRGICYFRQKRYGIIPEKIDVARQVVREKVKVINKTVVEEKVVTRLRCLNPVVVYDVKGDFVGEYESLSSAGRSLLGGRSLSMGCYTSGYIAYKKTSDDYPKKIESKDDMYGYAIGEAYKPKNELEYTPRMQDFGKMRLCSMHEKLKLSFPVNQFRLNGDFVAQYKSIRDASHDTGIPYSQIYACVMGKTRRCQGYIWQKADVEG